MTKHTIIDMSPSTISPEVIANADSSLAALDGLIAVQESVITQAHEELKSLTEQRHAAALHLADLQHNLEAANDDLRNAETAASFAVGTEAEQARAVKVKELQSLTNALMDDIADFEHQMNRKETSIWNAEEDRLHTSIELAKVTLRELAEERSRLQVVRTQLHNDLGKQVYEELVAQLATKAEMERNLTQEVASVRSSLTKMRQSMREKLAPWPSLVRQAEEEQDLYGVPSSADDEVIAFFRAHYFAIECFKACREKLPRQIGHTATYGQLWFDSSEGENLAREADRRLEDVKSLMHRYQKGQCHGTEI